MSEYVKKFETAASADNYVIADIPFITSIATNPILNLHCDEEGKKLVNTAGIVSVENAINLISFTIDASNSPEYGGTYDAEEGMYFGEWIASEYCPSSIRTSYYMDGDTPRHWQILTTGGWGLFNRSDNDRTYADDLIVANATYYEDE